MNDEIAPPEIPTNPIADRPIIQSMSILQILRSIIGAGIIIATLLTLFTPANLFSDQLINQMINSVQTDPNQQPSPTAGAAYRSRIGIVVGHWGDDKHNGAICSDGLSELVINLRVATLVRQYLINSGNEVDVLHENDKQLFGYQALALVALHTGSCEFTGNDASWFKVAAAIASPYQEKVDRLTRCLIDRYRSVTGLRYIDNMLNPDITAYHNFTEVHTITITAIMEMGYLNLDRTLLADHSDLVAKGIGEGILCYLQPDGSSPTDLPTP